MKKFITLLAIFISIKSVFAAGPFIWGVNGGSSASISLADKICFTNGTCIGAGGGSVNSVSSVAPLVTGGSATDPVLSLPKCDASTDGYLDNLDFITFAAKVGPTRSISTTAPLAGGGDLSANRTLTCNVASGSQPGCLASADFTTFNNKFSLPALTSGSVLFSDGATIAQDNTNFFWDDANNILRIGPNQSFGGKQTIRAYMNEVDPAEDILGSYLGYGNYEFTDDSFSAVFGGYDLVKVKVASGKTLNGGMLGHSAILSRMDAADEGTVGIAAGYFSQLMLGNSAHSIGQYAGYLTGFHSIDNLGSIGSMYDFLALGSNIPAGVVGTRYGIYIQPDTNYVKQNWLSGKVALGGDSYSQPTTTVKVNGNLYAEKNVTDSGVIGLEFHTSSHTTVDGDNSTTSLEGVATATVDSGVSNNKGLAGAVLNVTRGDGTDDGYLDSLSGSTVLLTHNAGNAGQTSKMTGYEVDHFLQNGIINTIYDYRSISIPLGSPTVTTHYGLYLDSDPLVAAKLNFVSGKILLGSNSYSTPSHSVELNSGSTPMVTVDTSDGVKIYDDTGAIFTSSKDHSIYYQSGAQAYDVENGHLRTSSGSNVVNVADQRLERTNTTIALEWENSLLKDTGGNAVAEWGTHLQSDGDFIISEGHESYSQAAAPTCTPDGNAGSGASCTSTGADSVGFLRIDTGLIGVTAGPLAVVTFNHSFTAAPYCVFSPADAFTASSVVGLYVASSTTDFTIGSAIGPSTSSSYKINYHCVQATN